MTVEPISVGQNPTDDELEWATIAAASDSARGASCRSAAVGMTPSSTKSPRSSKRCLTSC